MSVIVKSRRARSGLGMVGVLTSLFISLKIAHVLPWGWLWVLSPLWLVVSLTILVLLGLLGSFIYGITHISESLIENENID